MAILQPQSTDYLDSPDHAFQHRVIACDDASSVQALVVDSNDDIQTLGNINIASGKKFQINGSDLSYLDVGAISELVQDTTPQLGGDLDANGNKITGGTVITGQTEKGSPIATDNIIISDVADSGNLKKVQIGNLPAASSQNAYGSSVGQSTQTGTTNYAQKLSVNITPTATKTFCVQYSCLVAIDTKNSQVKSRIQVDNTDTYFEHNYYLSDDFASNSWALISGCFYTSLTAALHTIDLDYGVNATIRTAYIKEAYIIISELA